MVIEDTDILIKVYRGNKNLENQLRQLKESFGISAITAFELYQGVQSTKRLFELSKQLKSYNIIHINESISEKALILFRTYKSHETLLVGDTIIAATSLLNKLELFTDNKKDYDFIKGINFYKP